MVVTAVGNSTDYCSNFVLLGVALAVCGSFLYAVGTWDGVGGTTWARYAYDMWFGGDHLCNIREDIFCHT
jgi:hypothetical protein